MATATNANPTKTLENPNTGKCYVIHWKPSTPMRKGAPENHVETGTANMNKDTVRPDIVGRVACLTEFVPEYSPTPALAIKRAVNRDSAPRRARRWHV